MNVKTYSLLALSAVLAGCAPEIDPSVESAFEANKEPWKDPAVNAINRLEARMVVVPCETEKKAIDIAQRFASRNDSKWIQPLNGEWDFKWKGNIDRAWEKEAKVKVPGCWQLQGEFDPPMYVNIEYPIGFDGTGNPMVEPPKKDYTSFSLRNPVGLYSRTFTLPKDWCGRRTVIHFGGVSSAMYVRLNGKRVGYSEDSRLPAEFDLTPYLVKGENKLEVEVLKHCDGSYLEGQDFWRLSGIFRDVWLVSEHPEAPKDFIVETWLSEDYKVGKFIVRDEKGNVLKERTVPEPKLWNAETPYVYVTPLEFKHGWWIFGGTDYYTVSLGFRRIEIKDAVLTINGKRVLFKGADRHEMDPRVGYALTRQMMERDAQLMKELNLNAVRTCHYPDDPYWYDLCDNDGLYVVCEANIESHGAGRPQNKLAGDPRWLKAHLERGTRMVKTFRNHPSIIFWSMGNEAGMGSNFQAEYKAIRELDATRPIQYEPAGNGECSDIMCPMYTRPWDCEKYVTNAPKKPMILCEYTHAMGNSNGGIQKYWDLARKCPSFQGGFIWDFVDQALWKTDGRGKWLAYGGDWGEKPNDDNFNCNGFVDALRNFHPGDYEVRHAYQPVHVDAYDWATGTARVRNGYTFLPLDDVEGEWTISGADGAPVANGKLDLSDFAAGTEKDVRIEAKDGESVLFRFVRDDQVIAWDQFVKPFTPVAAPKAGAAVDRHPFKFNFWRAPTDNDRGWNMPNVCKVWKDATVSQQLPAGVKSDLRVSRVGDGELLVDWTLVVPKGLPPIPRVGLTFTLPASHTNVIWNGLGPWENYADRRTAALLGIRPAVVELATGLADPQLGTIRYNPSALNPDNYIEPGEQGYRTGCRWLMLSEASAQEVFEGKAKPVKVTALNAPFGFNAWPYAQSALEGPKHVWEMKKGDAVTVNVDAVQMGVGGDNSWGARPHDDVMPGAGTYSLKFIVSGLN